MPELPEVETITRDLNKKVKNRRVVDMWSDWPKYFKQPRGEKAFKKCVASRKILRARRRGKNILIELSGDHLLLAHQKMTGHFLYGKWQKNDKSAKGLLKKLGPAWEKEKWLPAKGKKNMTDPMNRFIRIIFFLDNGFMLALSDARRFARVHCGSVLKILALPELKKLGPEPLEKSFKFANFKKLFIGKKGRIKQVLMDQNFIVGIGNIYADEILYLTKIHPLSRTEKLGDKELKKIFTYTKKVLHEATKRKGTSIHDFRDTGGAEGTYGKKLLVYQKTGKKCPNGHVIKRIKIAARSAHFCPKEQKLYK